MSDWYREGGSLGCPDGTGRRRKTTNPCQSASALTPYELHFFLGGGPGALGLLAAALSAQRPPGTLADDGVNSSAPVADPAL